MQIATNQSGHTITLTERGQLLGLLREYLNARPCLSAADYGEQYYYQRAQREVGRQLADGLALLRTVSDLTGRGPRGDGDAHMSLGLVTGAFSQAWCGRLTWDGRELEYTAGQSYSMEYRGAACAVLARALKDYWSAAGVNTYVQARSFLGIGIARRWFK